MLLLLSIATSQATSVGPAETLSWRLDQLTGLDDPADRFRHARLRQEPRPDPDFATVVAVVDVWARPDDVLEAALALHPGIELEARHGQLLQLRVPVEALVDLSMVGGVARVREPDLPTSKAVVTEGKAEIFVNDWHASGVTGGGVLVGVLDVEFGGYESILGTELPDSVATTPGTLNTSGGTHGTAVAEIVHDIAPDADLHLYQFATEVEFYERCDQIVADGVEVLNASIGFDNVWHADGTSPYTQTVELVVDEGVTWVAASGNEVGRYFIGEVGPADGDGFVTIDGELGVPMNNVMGEVPVSLRWSEAPDAASIDLDLYLYDENLELCGYSEEPQDGDDRPYEYAACDVGGSVIWAYVVVASGNPEGLTAYLYAPYFLADSSWESVASTLTLPADSPSAITVGAYELDTLEVASFSSQGPTDDGRTKPDLVAPSGVSTSTYGGAFDGTSASAPHVAGVAALIRERTYGSPGEIKRVLTNQAEDLGEAGLDNTYGHGAVRTSALPDPWCGCTSATGAGGAWLFALLLAWRRRS